MSGSVDPGETLTFVVRLWRETDADGHSHWRGRVEHVASQEVGYVEDAAGVAHFIQRWTTWDEKEMPQER
jgi:hypothetical protein